MEHKILLCSFIPTPIQVLKILIAQVIFSAQSNIKMIKKKTMMYKFASDNLAHFFFKCLIPYKVERYFLFI